MRVVRWVVRSVVVTAVLLATGGSAPVRAEGRSDALYAECRRRFEQADAEQRAVNRIADDTGVNLSVAVTCEWPDGTPVDPALWLPALPALPATPAPTPAGTCVTGLGRPLAGTLGTTVTATVAGKESLLFEYQELGGGSTIRVIGSDVLTFQPEDLAPGETYRWRARVDDLAKAAATTGPLRERTEVEMGWSPWCEFTVSADAPDYRNLGDASVEALTELGVRPDRSYTVTLTGAHQRRLRAGTNVGRTGARMTLTGPRWTDLLTQLSGQAEVEDEVAAELANEDPPPPDGSASHALVDAISVQLGGPRHVRLG